MADPAGSNPTGADGLRRRDFLRQGVAATLGCAALPLAGGVLAGEPPRVRGLRTLGKTGLQIADIGFGASRLGEGQEAVVRHALERGVNYFDTAESYRAGASETTLGKALRGSRERVLIASKVSAQPEDTAETLTKTLEGSLRRLQTDRIDVYFNHAVNDVARLQNPAWGEFAARAKQQGKIRFTGMSGHAGNLIECVDHALDHDLVDVLLLAHNFGQDPAFYERLTRSLDRIAVHPDLPRVMKKARQKGVGVIAMKTLMGARLNDMRPFEKGGATFAQAAFRWVLSGPDVDALIVSMTSTDAIDEYLGASGATRLAAGDLDLLARYAAHNGSSSCRFGCGDCARACPEGVPISEVMRTRMYALDYRDLRLARDDYAELTVNAAACLGCAHQACTGGCTHGLDIAALTRDTHMRLGAA
jgi:predicted aldo/keto reductase-like oxidoreductase